ncbi:MAG: NAD(P)H-dependent oxidoreductase subunit E, partial [Woeseiaceae bacterium]
MAEALTAEEISARVEEIISAHADLEGPLLPILHGVQEAFGYVPRDALPAIASGLNLSRAEVHGVMSFYHDFREDRAGRHVLKLCRAEACQSMGADRIAEQVRGKLGIEWHETTQD